MKKIRFTLCLVLILCLLLSGCSGNPLPGLTVTPAASPAASLAAFSTPSPAASPAAAGNGAAYTLMLYITGTDLEQECGAATADIQEILESGLDSNTVNVVLQTGGCEAWQTADIPADTCMRYRVQDGALTALADVGDHSMGDADTLRDFVAYAMDAFPAQKYGLILWGHGDGPYSGVGQDQRYDYDGITLAELRQALSGTPAATTPLEFLGMDACLMGNVESACAAADYARYYIASPEDEPDGGWDYRFVQELALSPSGDQVAQTIAAGYPLSYQGHQPGEVLTLTAVDLSRVSALEAALGDLAAALQEGIQQDSYNALSRARNATLGMAQGGMWLVDSDMVDIADLANQLRGLYPQQAQSVLDALSACATLLTDQPTGAGGGGLSLYFPFRAWEDADERLREYARAGFSDRYVAFAQAFLDAGYRTAFGEEDFVLDDQGALYVTDAQAEDILDIFCGIWTPYAANDDYGVLLRYQGGMQRADNGKVSTAYTSAVMALNGHMAALYELQRTPTRTTYLLPITRNGEEMDLVVEYTDAAPQGRILGAQYPYESKEYPDLLPLQAGDELCTRYYVELLWGDFDRTAEDEWGWWEQSEPFTLQGDLTLGDYLPAAPTTFFYGYDVLDVYYNLYYSDVMSATYDSL